MADKKLFTFDEIRQKLANYCVYQDRCHQEVEQKMREFVLIPEAKEEILLYLMKENYLNEERFARSYARGKFYQKGWGRNKIRNELRFKGVSDRLINAAMQEIDPEDYVRTLRKSWDRYYAGLSGPEYQKNIRTTRYLLSRGFEYEEIRGVMGEG